MTPTQKFIEDVKDYMKRARWPEYHIEIPRQVVLQCPRCHAEHNIDVEVNEEHTTAHAELDTDFCEACGQLFCLKCPRLTVDGLFFCFSCKDAAEECSKECGKPIIAPKEQHV